MGGGLDSLKEVKGKMKKHRRVQQRVKFTYAKFARYYGSEEHGNYDAEGLRNKWGEETKDNEPCDFKGVENGTKGHARFRLVLEDADDSFSESESLTGRLHEKSTKPKDDVDHDDIVDFLAGGASLDFDGDVALPPELANILAGVAPDSVHGAGQDPPGQSPPQSPPLQAILIIFRIAYHVSFVK